MRGPGCGFAFRAVAADSAYGDQDGFCAELAEAGLPFVMALKPHRGTWAYRENAHTPVDAARGLLWGGPERARRLAAGNPGLPRRAYRDLVGRRRVARLGGRRPRRMVVATADPGSLPDKATWYLVTNLPRPGGPREAESPWPAAGVAEIVRIYGLRHWVEQTYKQVKDELGWADFQVRSDIAIRRHQALVNCAFTFCWLASQPPPGPAQAAAEEGAQPASPSRPGHACRPSVPSWPHALRAVRSWLTPAITLKRWWHAWSKRPRPLSSSSCSTTLSQATACSSTCRLERLRKG